MEDRRCMGKDYYDGQKFSMNKEYFDGLRLKNGITLEGLSEATGIPVGTLSKISSGCSKPSYHNMCLIAKELGCSLDDFTDIIDSRLTEGERELLNKYRTLNNHSKELVNYIIDLEAKVSKGHSEGNKSIIECFVPTGIYGDGSFYESCNVDIIEYTNIDDDVNAEFAIKMITDTLGPVFFRNDILLMSNRFPMNGEIAIFMNNHKQYIRKYYCTDKGIKLVGINDYSRNIENCNLKDFVCIGTLLTVLRGEVRMITPNKYKKIIGTKK